MEASEGGAMMAIVKIEKVEVCCDFCGKHQDFVKIIIAGKKSFICNECVDVCVKVIKEAQ